MTRGTWLGEGSARLDDGGGFDGIHFDALHVREVDHEASSTLEWPVRLWPRPRTATASPGVPQSKEATRA